jgi:sigma-B regulation protein RsbU (phosphoserine phosphatase)
MWGEPYFDKGGGNVYMSTYSHPIFTQSGTFLGVVTVDVELRHLAKQMKKLAKVQDGYVFLVSHDGFLLYHPDYQATLKETLGQYAKRIGSASLTSAAEAMRRDDSGVYKVTIHREKFLLYTMPVPETSWSIGVMQDYDALFAPLRGMKLRLLIIMVCGLGVILLTVVMVTNQLKATVSQEERTRNELAVAGAIQRSFLPEQDTFTKNEFSLCGVMQPAKEIGGDFYGYREADGKLLFYIGDVSGKGVPASLFMMASHVLIETTLDDSFDPARILQRTSEKLYILGKQRMFATMLVGVLDSEKKTLTFALAGHPPPLIKEGNNLYSPLAKFLPPVGVFESVPYENSSIEFSETAMVLGFTDGVTEAMTRTGELFGDERLTEVLAELSVDATPSTVRQKIEEAVAHFIKGNDPSDDLTLVAIKMGKEE